LRIKSELKVGGLQVRLSAVTIPLLHAVAEHDHIVPCAASRPLVLELGLEKLIAQMTTDQRAAIAPPARARWPHPCRAR
jgi:poly(3-hydroxyalkanoate) synthetase